MKTLRSILMAVALSAAVSSAIAADIEKEFFHPAASLYIHGDIAAASNRVARGLALYPDDAKLKRLMELLKQPPQEQQDKQNQKDQQNQDSRQQQKPDESDAQQDQSDQQKNEDGQQEQDANQQPDRDSEGSPPEPAQPQQPKDAGDISREEAMRMLNAMKQQEKNQRMRLRPVLGVPADVEKDW